MSELKALKVGDKAPNFTLPDINQVKVSLSDYIGKKNVMLVFYPLAFSPVCSAQIPSYQKIYDMFEELDTEIVAISIDSVFTHKAWADGLGGISYPLLSDFWPHGKVASDFGVFIEEMGFSGRALFVIDKEGIIQYVDVVDPKEIPEIEPVLDALRNL
jgi:peroxiredoxin (alkyl hydroperoxide reductase subunit C)